MSWRHFIILAGICVTAPESIPGVAATSTHSSKPTLTVKSVKPTLTALPNELTASGNIVAWQEATIGAKVNGAQLMEIRANVGDVVKRGQVLAVFDNETVLAEISQARASLAEAQGNASEAEHNAARARTLENTGALSSKEIAQYLTAEQTAKARVEVQRSALRLLQLRLKHGQVLAPDDGVISARIATVGIVASNGQELFRLIRLGRLEWRAEVRADELTSIKAGTKAKIFLGSSDAVIGLVRMVAPTIDPQTRVALVYVDLPVGSVAKAGMFARGQFLLNASNGLAVPQQSVVVRDGFSYVFGITTDEHVRQIKVKTGRRSGDRIEIIDGITKDSALVESGVGLLSSGDLVKVMKQ